MEKCYLTLQTSLEPQELRTRLKKWEPWSIRIDFSNGVSTNEFQRRIPFSEHPLSKFNAFEKAVPFPNLKGGRLLDLGCAFGYNSINVAAKYGLSCTGSISQQDTLTPRVSFLPSRRLIQNSLSATRRLLVALVNLMSSCTSALSTICQIRYLLADNFRQLTIGRLPGPGNTGIRPPEDPNICYFMHMQNNDKTNFLGFEYVRPDEVFGIARFSGDPRNPQGRAQRSCRTYVAYPPGRAQTGVATDAAQQQGLLVDL